jgi:hypothetical protein
VHELQPYSCLKWKIFVAVEGRCEKRHGIFPLLNNDGKREDNQCISFSVQLHVYWKSNFVSRLNTIWTDIGPRILHCYLTLRIGFISQYGSNLNRKWEVHLLAQLWLTQNTARASVATVVAHTEHGKSFCCYSSGVHRTRQELSCYSSRAYRRRQELVTTVAVRTEDCKSFCC